VFDRGIVDHGGLVETGNRGFVARNGKEQRETAHVARLLEVARKEIGVREASENSGPRVDQYNAYVGVRKAKWCASFVSWCFGQAGVKEPRTAWSPALFPRERCVKYSLSRLGNSGFAETARGLSRDTELRTSKNLGAGLVMGMYFDQLKRIAHCGIVERARNDLVYVIEGNTNLAGRREGDGVYRKIRHKRTIHLYADWLGTPSLREGTTKQSHICFGIVQWTGRVQGVCFGSLQSGLAMTKCLEKRR